MVWYGMVGRGGVLMVKNTCIQNKWEKQSFGMVCLYAILTLQSIKSEH